MIEITNYTTDTVNEFSHSDDLADYIEECSEENYEIGVTHCDIISINSLDEAIEFLDLSEEDKEKLSVVSETHGYSYSGGIQEALQEFDNLCYIRIDGATTINEASHKLNYEIGYEDDLNMILGCDSAAYEQLGRFIDDDDIAHILETEYTYVMANDSFYIIISS